MKTTTNRVATLASLTGLLLTAGIAWAGPDSDRTLNGDADQCFAETERAVSGANAASLSTAPCTRALRFEPISRQDRSAMLHNRGIIEQAQGDLQSAKTSFARAVRLSATVDSRNLALAQVAHRLGDLPLAVEQYDLLIESGYVDEDSAARERILSNRQKAAASMVAGQ